jgi:DNA-binding MarR family transcriptional regulator
MPASEGLPSDEAAQALRSFRQVFNAVKSHFQQLERRSGVGGALVWALSIIRSQPGIGTGALAASMDIHQSTASNLVKSLVERELVAVRKSALDRRSVELTILPAGRAVLRKAPAPFSGVLPDALAQLDPATLRSLNRDLAKLLAVLQKVDQRAAHIPLAGL